MRTREEYTNEINRLGRIGILITLVLLFTVPTVMAIKYDAFPSIVDFFKAAGGLMVMFVPIGISEVFIYAPILGSATYITFITGNIMNLKIPIADNAQQLMNTTKGSEESDVITMLAIGISAMVTIIIIIFGVILLVPLEPIMQSDVVQTASSNVLPALFGALIVGVLKSRGEVRVKGRVKAGILPFVLLLIANIIGFSTAGYEGLLLIIMIPITVGIARILYNKEYITIEIIKEEE